MGNCEFSFAITAVATTARMLATSEKSAARLISGVWARRGTRLMGLICITEASFFNGRRGVCGSVSGPGNSNGYEDAALATSLAAKNAATASTIPAASVSFWPVVKPSAFSGNLDMM